jgi:hypothetical protein
MAALPRIFSKSGIASPLVEWTEGEHAKMAAVPASAAAARVIDHTK